ncbi:hypothetical protein C8R44DRAFT_988424 [Mycena epipterygia]|nr:hypothetical protein C8R44DRAFT_988424 [Mycena epipterygia]
MDVLRARTTLSGDQRSLKHSLLPTSTIPLPRSASPPLRPPLPSTFACYHFPTLLVTFFKITHGPHENVATRRDYGATIRRILFWASLYLSTDYRFWHFIVLTLVSKLPRVLCASRSTFPKLTALALTYPLHLRTTTHFPIGRAHLRHTPFDIFVRRCFPSLSLVFSSKTSYNVIATIASGLPHSRPPPLYQIP